MQGKYSMIKRELKRDDWLIIIANLIPVFGVWFLGWSAVEVFTVYAMETLIVGILTILKLLIITIYKRQDTWHNKGQTTQQSGIFFILFFIAHFGIFAAVQTTIFSQVAGITPANSGPMHFFFHWWEYINEDIAWMLGGFVISYLARDFLPFLFRREYKTVSMMRLMFQPYGRVLIQQFTVILGSMFLSFGLGKVFILVFALAKIAFEVFADFNRLLDKTMNDLDAASGKK
jgi:hypothetical protein